MGYPEFLDIQRSCHLPKTAIFASGWAIYRRYFLFFCAIYDQSGVSKTNSNKSLPFYPLTTLRSNMACWEIRHLVPCFFPVQMYILFGDFPRSPPCLITGRQPLKHLSYYLHPIKLYEWKTWKNIPLNQHDVPLSHDISCHSCWLLSWC